MLVSRTSPSAAVNAPTRAGRASSFTFHTSTLAVRPGETPARSRSAGPFDGTTRRNAATAAAPSALAVIANPASSTAARALPVTVACASAPRMNASSSTVTRVVRAVVLIRTSTRTGSTSGSGSGCGCRAGSAPVWSTTAARTRPAIPMDRV
jgi:hypothetical protein